MIVYDARDGFNRRPKAFLDAYREWLEAHDVDPNFTFRTEHQGDLLRVYQYARDDRGYTYVTVDGEIALAVPFYVEIETPAPEPNDFA